jgi:hypothetical protein
MPLGSLNRSDLAIVSHAATRMAELKIFGALTTVGIIEA